MGLAQVKAAATTMAAVPYFSGADYIDAACTRFFDGAWPDFFERFAVDKANGFYGPTR